MCFEALDADLNNRKPLSLEAVQRSYNDYIVQKSTEKAKDPKISRLAADLNTISTSPASSSSNSLSTPGASTPATSTSSLDPVLNSAPLFVTWNTIDDDLDDPYEVSLRGCIGTFEAQPLSSGVSEYALISALHDTRFPPISSRELPRLQACVTLLTDFEQVDDPYDWVVGTHGVKLSFVDKGRRYGSTYLPDVASEQGWDREEALWNLVRKAGWMGSRSKWTGLDLKVTRYQGKRVDANHGEYKAWKAWAAETGR